jgi:D-alanyl-D-alanine carboxypeptidase
MFKIRLIGISLLFLTGCSAEHVIKATTETMAQAVSKPEIKPVETQNNTPAKQDTTQQPNNSQEVKTNPLAKTSQPAARTKPAVTPKPASQTDAITVVAQPATISVLVNKHNKLPDSYNPPDLVTTTVPFISTATSEKRKMRREAAAALAKMFAGAKQQGISLLGVSGYRSHATQTTLFNYYVKTDGYAKARTYSALPGTSEHETGLAIDVTGGNGKCAADDCFGGTPEASWLEKHAAEYGFIIRYPKGKDAITGYKYEPWHIRYVGTKIANEIMSKGITLEEYYNVVPVNN